MRLRTRPPLPTYLLICFTHLLWVYLLTDSEFICLDKLAKPYLVPNQLHRLSNSAHEVLATIVVARLMPVVSIKSFALFIKD